MGQYDLNDRKLAAEAPLAETSCTLESHEQNVITLAENDASWYHQKTKLSTNTC